MEIAQPLLRDLYITPLRHERMHIWLNLDPTRGMVVSKGRESIG